LSTFARNQGRSPPGSARPPPRAGAFAASRLELRWEGLHHKGPRTAVARPPGGRALPCVAMGGVYASLNATFMSLTR
jgi:hypothetical protein